MKKAWFLLCFLSFYNSLFAQLVWEKRQLEEFHPSLEDTQVEAHFPFVNRGNDLIHIREIQTSCGCTVATLNKKEYAPGEKGEVVAIFTFGERIGKQQKTVTVTTDDPKEPTVSLQFMVQIPELVQVMPGYTFWKVGEDKSPKAMAVRILQDFPVQLTVHSNNERFVPQLKTIRDGKEYELLITPTDTRDAAWGVITLKAQTSKSAKTKDFNVYAQIRGSESFSPSAETGSESKSLQIAPGFVFWQAGDAPNPKTMIVRVLGDESLSLHVSSSNTKFVPQLKTVRAGKEYELIVKPTNTSEPSWSIITLDGQSKDGPKSFRAYALIRTSAISNPSFPSFPEGAKK